MSADPGDSGSPRSGAAGTTPYGPSGQPPPSPDPGPGGPGDPPAPAKPAPSPGDRGDARSYAEAARHLSGKDFEQKQHAEAQARADFQSSQFSGPVYIGGTFGLAFGQGTTQIKARRITAEELTEPFIRIDVTDRLATSFSDQPLVVVQGPKGYGKGAALVRTLRGFARDDTAMFYLDPSTDLATFSCAELPEDSVFILQDLPDEVADHLDEHAAKRIESELRARNCLLGITTVRAVRLATRSTGFLVIELNERPSPREVFDRHLAALLLGTGLTRKEMSNWPGVSSLLGTELGSECSLADAQRLATLLFRAREEPDSAARRVRVQMTEYADEKVAQWFRRLDSQQAHCMAISLAVLNGMAREVIACEAEILEKIILPAPDAPNAPPSANPFAAENVTSPALLDARVGIETRMTDNGPIVIQAMSYREPGYPGRVLRFVWRERDAARAALIEWLRHLGASPNLVVRVRAATAVGVLACEAMDYIYQHVIVAWASSDDPVIRDSAAIAFGSLADDPELRPTVRSVVTDWAKDDTNWKLQAAAARAYGRVLGLDSPSAALRELGRLADLDDFDVTIAVANSYCELVLEGTTALSIRVMGEIERLAGGRKRDGQITGRLALLGLSNLRGAPPDLSEHEERFAAWPTLLLLALANATLAESAARLWQLSLHDPDIGPMVIRSLDDWATDAEEIGELRSSLVAFLRWVAADERARQSVLRRARIWMAREGQAPETGRSVLEDLS